MLKNFYIIIWLVFCIAILSACESSINVPMSVEQRLNQNLKLFEEELAQELTLSHEELNTAYEKALELFTDNLSDEEAMFLEIGDGTSKKINDRIFMSTSETFQIYIATVLEIDIDALAKARAKATEDYIYEVGRREKHIIPQELLPISVSNYRLQNYEGGDSVAKLKISRISSSKEATKAFLNDAFDDGVISLERIRDFKLLEPCGLNVLGGVIQNLGSSSSSFDQFTPFFEPFPINIPKCIPNVPNLPPQNEVLFTESGHTGNTTFRFNIVSNTQNSGMIGASFGSPNCTPHVRVLPQGRTGVSVYLNNRIQSWEQVEGGEIYTYCGNFDRVRVYSTSTYDVRSSHSIIVQ